MPRYIDADGFRNWILKQKRLSKHYTVQMLDETPTADVEEVKHGEWVTVTVPRHDPHGEKFCLCTNCKRMWRKELLVAIAFGNLLEHCPNCDAKMNGQTRTKEVR